MRDLIDEATRIVRDRVLQERMDCADMEALLRSQAEEQAFHADSLGAPFNINQRFSLEDDG